MINLIPNKEKKKKVKDFYFRLTTVFIFAVGLCVALGTVSLLPTYFLSAISEELASDKLAEQQSQLPTQADQDVSAATAELDSKLRLIETVEKNKYSVSDKVVHEITLRKMADIKITKIVYEIDPLNGKEVTVLGLAPSRERLLLFRQALEDDIAFKKVELPISNFVKGSNIEFSLSLIPS